MNGGEKVGSLFCEMNSAGTNSHEMFRNFTEKFYFREKIKSVQLHEFVLERLTITFYKILRFYDLLTRFEMAFIHLLQSFE